MEDNKKQMPKYQTGSTNEETNKGMNKKQASHHGTHQESAKQAGSKHGKDSMSSGIKESSEKGKKDSNCADKYCK